MEVADIGLSVIVAMTPGRVIGMNGKLPWYLPSDLARFKRITMETGVVVMGCKTYESILHRNARPLPDRKHVVLTRKRISSYIDNVYLAHSPEEALRQIAVWGGRACIIGGEQVYKLFLPLPQVKTVHITTVYAPELIGDAYFPELVGDWQCLGSCSAHRLNPEDEFITSYEVYERCRERC